MRLWHLLVVAAVTLSVAPRSFAQNTTGTAIAEALFQEGRTLMDQQRYATACAKFAESQRLDPNMSTLLNLGYCYEQEGKTVAAWITFREAAAMARRANRPDRLKVAEQRSVTLAARMPKLTLALTESVPSLVIAIDGTALSPSVAGILIPIDPGSHELVVMAEGKQRWSKTFEIPESGVTKVMIPALVDAPADPTPPAVPVAPLEMTWWMGQHVVGLATVGLGAASLGVGAALGALTLAKASEVDAECDGDVCSQKGIDLNDTARQFAVASTILFIAGGVLTAMGLTVALTGPDEPVEASVTVEPGAVGLRVAF